MDEMRLSRYRETKTEIDQLRRVIEKVEEREELWSAITSGVARIGDGMPRAGNHGHPDDKLVNFISRDEELEREIKNLLAYYRAKLKLLTAEQLAVEKAIDALPDKERKVLRAYYIEGMDWEEAEKKLNYSRRHLYRIHDRAIEILEQAPEA